MPDINKITVSGLVTNTWSYRDDLYAMLAIYDAAAPGEDVAQLLAQLRSAGVGADRLEQVAAILDPAAEDRPRQNAHYATVRFEHGLGPDGQPVSLAVGMRLYVSGKYHEDRGIQNLWRAIRQAGLDTTQFSPGLRQQLEGAGFTRPAPYIIPEGFSVLQRNGNGGKRSRRRSAPANVPEAAAAPPPVEEIPATTRRGGLTVSEAAAALRPVVEEPPAAATAAPTRRRRATKPPAEVPEVAASSAEEAAAPQSAEAAAPETAAT